MKLIKSTTVWVLIFLFCLSCKKDNTPGNANESLPTGSVLAIGSFTSDAHTTSGAVKIILDAGGNKHLVFENFRTDNGPDLRVWLSPNLAASPYIEIGDLKGVTGNFSYPLPAGINTSANNRVLIWCEDFSVLFGSAVLQ